MSEHHHTEVTSNFLSPGWWAECSCGWVGVLRDDADAAALDAASHREFEAASRDAEQGATP
jgi:hypothetical protein